MLLGEIVCKQLDLADGVLGCGKARAVGFSLRCALVAWTGVAAHLATTG